MRQLITSALFLLGISSCASHKSSFMGYCELNRFVMLGTELWLEQNCTQVPLPQGAPVERVEKFATDTDEMIKRLLKSPEESE